MRTIYFDCFAGASGNMILAALIAAGVNKNLLEKELRKLEIPEFDIRVETVDRSGISSLHLEVIVPDERKHRHLEQIEKLIGGSTLSDSIKDRSTAIFRRLAEAEAKVHGKTVQEIHFHEVGGLDAIVDIVGACIGFEMLGIERFASSKINVGGGFVTMKHGKFPVPPPAVSELLKGKPIYSTEIEGELTTPTGAAIISTVCDSYGRLPEITLEGSAYGAGTRNYDGFPNVIRLLIGQTKAKVSVWPDDSKLDKLTLLETNIDDSTPQVLGFVLERAFELQALDCWFTPIQMKKNRPAFLLSILCGPEKAEAIKEMVFAETSTIGIRQNFVERESLDREIRSISTKYGDVRIKFASRNGKVINAVPEYDDVRRIALEKGIAFRIVSDAVIKEIADKAFVARVA